MRYFPEEIEFDLLTQGFDIIDWWNRSRDEGGRLKLSSRRLVLIITGIRDDVSAFKASYREDWSQDQYTQAGILNEIRLLRADNVAIHSEGKMEPMLMKSPKQLELEEDKSSEMQAIRGGILAQLHGGRNPSE